MTQVTRTLKTVFDVVLVYVNVVINLQVVKAYTTSVWYVIGLNLVLSEVIQASRLLVITVNRVDNCSLHCKLILLIVF